MEYFCLGRVKHPSYRRRLDFSETSRLLRLPSGLQQLDFCSLSKKLADSFVVQPTGRPSLAAARSCCCECKARRRVHPSPARLHLLCTANTSTQGTDRKDLQRSAAGSATGTESRGAFIVSAAVINLTAHAEASSSQPDG